MTSRCPGSTERTPSCTLSMIGKKPISAAMMIFELMPKPNQITNSGMSATLGTTWEATMSGRRLISISGTLPRITPVITPKTSAIRKPTTASVVVTWASCQVWDVPSALNRLSKIRVGAGRISSETFIIFTPSSHRAKSTSNSTGVAPQRRAVTNFSFLIVYSPVLLISIPLRPARGGVRRRCGRTPDPFAPRWSADVACLLW